MKFEVTPLALTPVVPFRENITITTITTITTMTTMTTMTTTTTTTTTVATTIIIKYILLMSMINNQNLQ